MTALNLLATRVADAVLGPLASWPPVVVLLLAALATALVVLGVMRVASNQAALADVKRQVHASLLEMRLFNDDLRGLLRAQGGVLRHNARYVWLSALPLLVTALPITLVIAQLQAWYGYDGLAPGVPTTITAVLVDAPAGGALPRLEAPGLDMMGEARYFPTLGQVAWRVVPRAIGTTVVRVVTASGASDKSVHIAGADVTARRSPSRDRGGVLSQLLYPSERPLATSDAVSAIHLAYPERSVRIWGFETHWLVPYLAATFALVLLLRRPLGVVI